MRNESPNSRHERIHQEAAAKRWDYGNWGVAPLTQEHRDNMVVEFVRRKFPDCIWVTINSLEAGYVPDFDDQSLWRSDTKEPPTDAES